MYAIIYFYDNSPMAGKVATKKVAGNPATIAKDILRSRIAESVEFAENSIEDEPFCAYDRRGAIYTHKLSHTLADFKEFPRLREEWEKTQIVLTF